MVRQPRELDGIKDVTPQHVQQAGWRVASYYAVATKMDPAWMNVGLSDWLGGGA